MPTKEQMKTAFRQIADVIGRNYIEGDGDQCSCWFQPEGGGPVGRSLFQGAPVGTPEPFTDLPDKARIELLVDCVDWEGFTGTERRSVQQRVLEGGGPESWMNGIQVAGHAMSPKALFSEWTADYAAAQTRDRGWPEVKPDEKQHNNSASRERDDGGREL
jgi:hypothetical protein